MSSKHNMSKHENGDVVFSELAIGKEYLNLNTGRLSKVLELTANSVNMFNAKSNKSKHKDDDFGEKGKLAGIDSTCWYDITLFNRVFRSVEDLDAFKAEKRAEFDRKMEKSGGKWRAQFERDYL